MRIAKKQARAARRRRPTDAGAAKIDVTVQVATRSRPLPAPAEFRKWVRAACSKEARITVRLVDTPEGMRLNRKYRGRDYATNVLTFTMSETAPCEGDLALCAPIVKREAREQAKPLKAHYAHLTVHGVLHLQGYDHEAADDARAMERREARILKKLGYSDPYECGSSVVARKPRRPGHDTRATHGRHTQ